MIIYLSQGTQKTQNTQMNADLYFSADRRSPLFSANLCARLRHLRSPNQPAKFPFISVLLLNKNKCQIPAFTPHLWGTIPYAHDWRMTYPPGRVL